VLEFVRLLEGMKTHTRTAWSSTGRHESIAEHSWRVAMLALTLAPSLPSVDPLRLLEICLVHDLGEVFEGDISAPLQDTAGAEKERIEREAVERLASTIGGETGERVLALWSEYAAASSPEARAAKVLDKLETIIQHNQGRNPSEFDYEYNLGYGASLAHDAPILRRLRELVDEETRSKATG
jgi:putative hydrolase of HD superfamily